MRIIAGEFRGRKLLAPETDATRPITDRVKQSLFDILTPLLPDAVVYDCFSGTGSMGLECLSRGAARAVFFDADRSAVARLKKNIEAIRVGDRTKVVAGDLFKWFAGVASDPRADLIFLDPPYRFLTEKPDALLKLAAHFAKSHLAQSGTVVFRHDIGDSLELRPLQCYDRREYGGMVLELLKHGPEIPTQPPPGVPAQDPETRS